MSIATLFNPIGEYYGIWICFFTALCFFYLSQILKYGNSVPEKASRSYFDLWYWSSFIISMIHASLVGVLSLLCVTFNREVLYHIDLYYEPSYLVICISTGYFIYDLFDEILHRDIAPISQYVIHHILALTILLPCVLTGCFTSIAITGLTVEFHNVFLHSRVIISFYGYDEKPKVKNSLNIANLITCVIFRLILFPWIGHIIAKSELSLPFVIILYSELLYIFTYSVYIFALSVKTDFPVFAERLKTKTSKLNN